MAELKKNAVNQILFTMVDKVDFSTPETSLASDFTVKRFGVNRGSAAANVSTLSRIVSKVGSGVYRLSLEANACNYDFMFLRIAHASAATQMLAFEMKTLADDDTSDLLSKVYVQNLVLTSTLSDIDSAITSQYTAGFNLTASAYSDIQSRVDVCLDTAFTDASSPTANGLKERIRTIGWILRNKMKVLDASGNVTLYKDNSTDTAYTVGGALLDDGTSTVRKRIE